VIIEKDIDKIKEIYEKKLYLILKQKRYEMLKEMIMRIRKSVFHDNSILVNEIFSTFAIYLTYNITEKEQRKINEINFLINKFTFTLICRLLKENNVIYDRTRNITVINNPYTQLREYVRRNFHGTFTIYSLLREFDGRYYVSWCKTNQVEKILQKGMLLDCEKILQIIEKVNGNN
jgi:hypothetical protein